MTITPETAKKIMEWKQRQGLQSADESEYRFLLRDLTLVADRVIDPDVDLLLSLGGEGPLIASFIRLDSRAKMFFLTETGEMLHGLSISDTMAYESSLFWLILRNRVYLPLIQQLVLNPQSYRTNDLRGLVETSDSTSRNCTLMWLKYFGIVAFSKGYRLQVEALARWLMAAAILELNKSLVRTEHLYAKEVDRRLNDAFSLSPAATDFVAALGVIFRHATRRVVKGYTSGRNDVSLPGHPNISIVRFMDEVPLSIAFSADVAEILRVVRYASEH